MAKALRCFSWKILLACLLFGQTVIAQSSEEIQNFINSNTNRLLSSPNLTELLRATNRPTIEDVVVAAEKDGFFDQLHTHSVSKLGAEVLLAFAQLEARYGAFQFITLGRDAVTYSDFLDAVNLRRKRNRQTARIDMSGELFKNEKTETIFEYLFQQGVPSDKETLLHGPALLFYDFTEYGPSSQLATLMKWLSQHYKVSSKEMAVLSEKLVPLVSSLEYGRANDLQTWLSPHDFLEVNPIQFYVLPRAKIWNGKFTNFFISNEIIKSNPSELELPTEEEKKAALLEMLYFIYETRAVDFEQQFEEARATAIMDANRLTNIKNWIGEHAVLKDFLALPGRGFFSYGRNRQKFESSISELSVVQLWEFKTELDKLKHHRRADRRVISEAESTMQDIRHHDLRPVLRCRSTLN